MNLHRTSGKPDWETIKPTKRNGFQKVAAATNGYLTIPNIITIIGLGIVLYGLWAILEQNYWLGLVLLTIGRLLDIADGNIAELTHTKSPLGEIFDAAADKVGTFLTIFTLFIASVTDWWVIAALMLPQIIIPFVIVHKKRHGISVHPTRSGKLSMGAAWVGIVGLLLIKALGEPFPLVLGIYSIIGLSILLGFYAVWQYSSGKD